MFEKYKNQRISMVAWQTLQLCRTRRGLPIKYVMSASCELGTQQCRVGSGMWMRHRHAMLPTCLGSQK